MKVVVNLADRRMTSSGLPGVEVINRGSRPWIQVNDRQWPLWLVERASKLPPGIVDAVTPGAIGLVLGAQIPDDERVALEDEGLAWWDLRGALHLERDDVLIHIDRQGRRPSRTLDVGTGRVLGPVGVRAAQFLIEGERGHRWSVSALAAQAGVSMGQAHNVFDLLESEQLVQALGVGASKRRVVVDRERLLEWLGATESRLRLPTGAFTYMYAANEVQLMQRFHEAAQKAEISYAVTSTVGARFRRVPVTTSVVTRVRVDGSDMDGVLGLLGLPVLDADEAGRGANLELWPDTGKVGTFSRTEIDGAFVAPESRIWLDLMRQGGRYADGASLLKERILERP
ncbi:hypothetical protein [Microbacterium sp. Mcb102]|uniref:hypothetical protein n=1 Tax=Microbacterium sp. Mcb102 TaxID=2926012 RepID=UPI0021C5925B|nr:hypothetical protein [Microbacterium sp. Mcb102]